MSDNKTQPEIIKDIIENDDNMAAIDDMIEEEMEQDEVVSEATKDEVVSEANEDEVVSEATKDEVVSEANKDEVVSEANKDEVVSEANEDEEEDADSPAFIPKNYNPDEEEDADSPEFIPGVTNMPEKKDEDEDEGEDEGDGEDGDDGEDDSPEVIPNKPAIQNATVVDVGPKAVTSSLQENDDSDDDSEDENEEVYQKLEKFENKELLLNYHPETKQIKYADVMALTTISRDSENNIIDPMHKTIPILTRYERARVLGVRAKQLEHNAIPMIDIPANMIDSYLIACEELKQKKIPFIIKRPMPDGTSEYWKLEDLEIVEY